MGNNEITHNSNTVSAESAEANPQPELHAFENILNNVANTTAENIQEVAGTTKNLLQNEGNTEGLAQINQLEQTTLTELNNATQDAHGHATQLVSTIENSPRHTRLLIPPLRELTEEIYNKIISDSETVQTCQHLTTSEQYEVVESFMKKVGIEQRNLFDGTKWKVLKRGDTFGPELPDNLEFYVHFMGKKDDFKGGEAVITVRLPDRTLVVMGASYTSSGTINVHEDMRTAYICDELDANLALASKGNTWAKHVFGISSNSLKSISENLGGTNAADAINKKVLADREEHEKAKQEIENMDNFINKMLSNRRTIARNPIQPTEDINEQETVEPAVETSVVERNEELRSKYPHIYEVVRKTLLREYENGPSKNNKEALTHFGYNHYGGSFLENAEIDIIVAGITSGNIQLETSTDMQM